MQQSAAMYLELLRLADLPVLLVNQHDPIGHAGPAS
jgi:hypothetical protein